MSKAVESKSEKFIKFEATQALGGWSGISETWKYQYAELRSILNNILKELNPNSYQSLKLKFDPQKATSELTLPEEIYTNDLEFKNELKIELIYIYSNIIAICEQKVVVDKKTAIYTEKSPEEFIQKCANYFSLKLDIIKQQQQTLENLANYPVESDEFRRTLQETVNKEFEQWLQDNSNRKHEEQNWKSQKQKEYEEYAIKLFYNYERLKHSAANTEEYNKLIEERDNLRKPYIQLLTDAQKNDMGLARKHLTTPKNIRRDRNTVVHPLVRDKYLRQNELDMLSYWISDTLAHYTGFQSRERVYVDALVHIARNTSRGFEALDNLGHQKINVLLDSPKIITLLAKKRLSFYDIQYIEGHQELRLLHNTIVKDDYKFLDYIIANGLINTLKKFTHDNRIDINFKQEELKLVQIILEKNEEAIKEKISQKSTTLSLRLARLLLNALNKNNQVAGIHQILPIIEVDYENKKSAPLLHLAVAERYNKIIEIFLLNRSQQYINAADKNGLTPLDHAVSSKNNVLVKKLLINGAIFSNNAILNQILINEDASREVVQEKNYKPDQELQDLTIDIIKEPMELLKFFKSEGQKAFIENFFKLEQDQVEASKRDFFIHILQNPIELFKTLDPEICPSLIESILKLKSAEDVKLKEDFLIQILQNPIGILEVVNSQAQLLIIENLFILANDPENNLRVLAINIIKDSMGLLKILDPKICPDFIQNFFELTDKQGVEVKEALLTPILQNPIGILKSLSTEDKRIFIERSLKILDPKICPDFIQNFFELTDKQGIEVKEALLTPILQGHIEILKLLNSKGKRIFMDSLFILANKTEEGALKTSAREAIKNSIELLKILPSGAHKYFIENFFKLADNQAIELDKDYFTRILQDPIELLTILAPEVHHFFLGNIFQLASNPTVELDNNFFTKVLQKIQ